MPKTPPGPPLNMMLDKLCPRYFHTLSLSLTVLVLKEHVVNMTSLFKVI